MEKWMEERDVRPDWKLCVRLDAVQAAERSQQVSSPLDPKHRANLRDLAGIRVQASGPRREVCAYVCGLLPAPQPSQPCTP